VCVDRFCVRRGVVVNELVENDLSGIRNNLEANLALALHCSNRDSFVPLVTPAHAANLSSNVGFIHFYDSAQKLAVNLTHRRPNSMTKMPSCFIGNVQRASHLQRGHSFLRFCHEIDRQKPPRQWKVGIVKDCAASCRKLVTAVVTIVLVALYHARDTFRLATRTRHAFGPAQGCKLRPAFFVASELLNKLWKVHVAFEGFGWFFVHNYA